MSLHLVLLGAPGAGKGTQAKRIAKARKVVHVSTGDILRDHIRRGTALGRKIQNSIEAGRLASDAIANEIVAERLAEKDCENGFIFDGFPRTVPQAEYLTGLLEKRGETLDAAVYLKVEDNDIVQRLSARRVCSRCGAIYSLLWNPPRSAAICDLPQCEGEALIQRADDHEDTIRARLGIYHATAAPLMEYYVGLKKLSILNAGGMNADRVFNTVEELLGSRDKA